MKGILTYNVWMSWISPLRAGNAPIRADRILNEDKGAQPKQPELTMFAVQTLSLGKAYSMFIAPDGDGTIALRRFSDDIEMRSELGL